MRERLSIRVNPSSASGIALQHRGRPELMKKIFGEPMLVAVQKRLEVSLVMCGHKSYPSRCDGFVIKVRGPIRFSETTDRLPDLLQRGREFRTVQFEPSKPQMIAMPKAGGRQRTSVKRG